MMQTMLMPPRVPPRLAESTGVAVCLATGPSLTAEDCAYVRGKAAVIAVNDAHRLAPWADILYSSDRRWWPHYKGVPTFEGLRYGVGSAPGKRNPFRDLPIQVLQNTGYTGLELKPDGLRTARNSGYAAINLAVHLGPRRIVLLGYNMNGSGPAHFFGNHPAGLNQTRALYPGWAKSFDALVRPLAEAGIEIFNCTENSSLEAFPRRRLREVL